jgi:hypothetical protein
MFLQVGKLRPRKSINYVTPVCKALLSVLRAVVSEVHKVCSHGA